MVIVCIVKKLGKRIFIFLLDYFSSALQFMCFVRMCIVGVGVCVYVKLVLSSQIFILGGEGDQCFCTHLWLAGFFYLFHRKKHAQNYRGWQMCDGVFFCVCVCQCGIDRLQLICFFVFVSLTPNIVCVFPCMQLGLVRVKKCIQACMRRGLKVYVSQYLSVIQSAKTNFWSFFFSKMCKCVCFNSFVLFI